MGDERPNPLFIMSDDHAAHAISAYGSRINATPNLDRLADGGMRFDSVFCVNSICTPSPIEWELFDLTRPARGPQPLRRPGHRSDHR